MSGLLHLAAARVLLLASAVHAQERITVDTTPVADAKLREIMKSLPATDDDGATLLILTPLAGADADGIMSAPVSRGGSGPIRLRSVDPHRYDGKVVDTKGGNVVVKDR